MKLKLSPDTKELCRTMFRIALPAAFGSLISFLVVIVDDIMVSSVGNGVAAQSAVSQVNSLTALFTAAVTGLISGSSVLLSQYLGKRDNVAIKRIFSIVLLICAALSIVVTAAIRLFPRVTVSLLVSGDEAEVVSLAVDYICIVCFSYIPYAISTALTGMLRYVESVRLTLYVSLVSLVANILLNYALIFGRLGAPALGVKGAAIATVAARLIELAIVCIYVFRIQKSIDFRVSDVFRLDRPMLGDYMKYGFTVGIADAQWALIGVIKAAIIGRLGATFMAANSIGNASVTLGTLFAFSLAGGACVAIGKAVGAGDREKAIRWSGKIQKMFLVIGIAVAILLFLLRRPFVSLYGSSSDPAVASLAADLVAIVAVTLIGTCYHASCFIGINRGGGDSQFVFTVDMICGWLVVLPATLIAAFVLDFPPVLVFLATRIDQCFKWIVALLRLRSGKWIRNVTRENE